MQPICVSHAYAELNTHMRPRHIAYIIWAVIALLGAVCLCVPQDGWHIGSWDLRFPTLTEALDLDQTSDIFPLDTLDLATADTTITNDSVAVGDTIAPTDTATQKTVRPVIPEVKIQNPNGDTRAHLALFYQALDSADMMPVRVVHYGDSQIEEDRITNILRERWQKAYGGGGVGLIPLHQTIPTRSIAQRLLMNGITQSTQGGPKRYLVYGPRSMRLSDNDYGVMGQVAVMDSNLVAGSEEITLTIEPIAKKAKTYNYFSRVRLLTDSAYVMKNCELRILNSQAASLSSDGLFHLPDSTTHCELHLQGRGKVYGVSLETPTGVIVDNIPMRGCSGNIFTRIDSTALSTFYQETNTRLIILQFGGNMIPQTENPATINGYVKTLRQQVRYLRACAPGASILFIGPSDMSTRIDGEMKTYPLVPYLDRMLQKMAQEEQIAYWSMYKAMGGENSMVKWVEIGLAGSDYVHFTRSGANKIGKTLGTWLDEYPTKPTTQTTL